MNTKYTVPEFNGRSLELQYENNEIWICGTKEGLKQLSDLILDLIERPKKGHTHLEDYELLTENSLIGALVIYKEKLTQSLPVSERQTTSRTPNRLSAWLKRLLGKARDS